MKIVAALNTALLMLPVVMANAESRLGLGEWNAFKPYQVTGVLSSNQILVLQADVYFTCQLDDQGSFSDLSPCQPILTFGQRYLFAEQEVAAEKAYQDGLKAEAQRVKNEEAAALVRGKELAEISQVTPELMKDLLISLAKERGCFLDLDVKTIDYIVLKLGLDVSKLKGNQFMSIRQIANKTLQNMVFSGEVKYLNNGTAQKKLVVCE